MLFPRSFSERGERRVAVGVWDHLIGHRAALQSKIGSAELAAASHAPKSFFNSTEPKTLI